MSITPLQAKRMSDLADLLQSFLPGSGNAGWSGHYTFRNAAAESGVEAFWSVGSKRRALLGLLERTFEQRREKFCDLVERVVRKGLPYRQSKKEPVTRAEIESLNVIVAGIGCPIRALCDATFLASLVPNPTPAPATSTPPADNGPPMAQTLAELRKRFYTISDDTNRQRAGYALERLLGDAFDLFSIRRDGAFRVVGEQIDGALTLGGLPYLVEAKWTKQQIGIADLYAFLGKVEGKSTITRGLFFSMSGFTIEAREALMRGKALRLVLVDGAHLHRVLDGAVRFDVLLRELILRLDIRGEPYTPIAEL